MALADWWRRTFRAFHRSQWLITLTVVLVVVFAYTVVRAVRSERYKLMMTTCYFAADATRVLVAQSETRLQSATAPIFAAVGGRAPLAAGAPLLSPSVLAAAAGAAAAADRCQCAPRLPAAAYFRVDITNGVAGSVTVAARSDSASPSGAASRSAGSLAAAAAIDTAGIRTAVDRTVTLLDRPGPVAAAVTGTPSDSDALQAIAVLSPKVGADGQLRAVYGVLAAPGEFVRAIMEPVFKSARLFPWVMADGMKIKNADISGLVILDSHWTPIYESGPIPPFVVAKVDVSDDCYGMAPIQPAMANLMTHMVVRPEAAARWVAMNTDTSQLASLAVLLVGILACSAAAAFAARREAELAGLRSDFVTSISHELRMPLAQILLFGETLSLDRARSQAERDEAADAIVRETQRLAGVVDNVLYFSRIEHHNLAVVTEPVDLAAFVDDTVADMRLLADDARIALDASVPPALVVQIDRGAFRRVLFDLVDNAIKYGPRGQRVTIAAREAAPGRVWLWVEDQGKGIPAGSEAVIFDPFVRLPRDRNSPVAGSGLGLAVVRELVAGHGGRIWVERGASGGARFVIDIPGGVGNATATAGVTPGVAPGAAQDRRTTNRDDAGTPVPRTPMPQGPKPQVPKPQADWP